MFSGLVREVATIKSFSNNTLEVISSHKAQIGDSIAINGVCLTATKCSSGVISMELSHHTQQSIAMENFTPNSRVHFEPALRMGDGLDGHIVQGHIDGIGVIECITHKSEQSDFWISCEKHILRYMIPKGSVCVDGISLTITESSPTGFGLTIIPHTLAHTLFGQYKQKRRVNLESDIIVRSVINTLGFIAKGGGLGGLDSDLSSHKTTSWAEIDAKQMGY